MPAYVLNHEVICQQVNETWGIMSKIKHKYSLISTLKYWSSSITDDEAPSASHVQMRTTQGIWIAQVEDSQCCKNADLERFNSTSLANNSSCYYTDNLMSNFK